MPERALASESTGGGNVIQLQRAYDDRGKRDGLRILVERLWPQCVFLRLVRSRMPRNRFVHERFCHHDIAARGLMPEGVSNCPKLSARLS